MNATLWIARRDWHPSDYRADYLKRSAIAQTYTPDGFSYVRYDFDAEADLYARWYLAMFVRLGCWWASKRWIIERNLRHRIFIVREGEHCRYWKLAPLRKWGFKRNWRRMEAP